MKNLNIFIYSLIFIFSSSVFAQKDTIWYDSNWKKTTKNQASYYRPTPEKKDKGYVLKDYYLLGNKQMIAFSLEPNENHFQGNVIHYFENGNIWQEAEYKDGVLHGVRKRNYENGKVKNLRTNIDGKIHGDWKEFFKTGQIKEMGNYQQDKRVGIWNEYYKNGKLKGRGKYSNDKKAGTWEMYYYDDTPENE